MKNFIISTEEQQVVVHRNVKMFKIQMLEQLVMNNEENDLESDKSAGRNLKQSPQSPRDIVQNQSPNGLSSRNLSSNGWVSAYFFFNYRNYLDASLRPLLIFQDLIMLIETNYYSNYVNLWEKHQFMWMWLMKVLLMVASSF